jgi:arsenite-transporting ATPase
MVGYKRLKAISDQIYGDKSPVDRFFHGAPYQLNKQNGEYELILKLPFILKKDLELNRISNELVIRVGSFKRHMLLPRKVAAAEKIVARLEDQNLHINFKGVDNGKT